MKRFILLLTIHACPFGVSLFTALEAQYPFRAPMFFTDTTATFYQPIQLFKDNDTLNAWIQREMTVGSHQNHSLRVRDYGNFSRATFAGLRAMSKGNDSTYTYANANADGSFQIGGRRPRGGSASSDWQFSNYDSTKIFANGKEVVRVTDGNLRVHSATTNPSIEFDADASANLASTIRFTRSGSVRWNLIGANGESGTDDFQISRYNNSGIVQGTPLKIIRSTGEIEMNGNLRVYSATTNPNIEFDADASVNLASTIRFTRSGSVRWNLIGSNGESGTDDFQISRYNNSGVVQGTPLKIIRSTGDIEMSGNLRMYSATTNPVIRFDADAGANLASIISFTRSGSIRWNLIGSNGNSGVDDFNISRYNDSGVFQDSPLKIIRSSGIVELAQALPTASGGTGLTGFSAANRLLYSTSSSALATLAAAGSASALTMDGGAPTWTAGWSGTISFSTDAGDYQITVSRGIITNFVFTPA